MYKRPVVLRPELPQREAVEPESVGQLPVYELLWRKKSNKMHKSWEGDAVGIVRAGTGSTPLSLEIKADGRSLGIIRVHSTKLETGQLLAGSGYEFEVGARCSIVAECTPQRVTAPMSVKAPIKLEKPKFESPKLDRTKFSKSKLEPQKFEPRLKKMRQDLPSTNKEPPSIGRLSSLGQPTSLRSDHLKFVPFKVPFKDTRLRSSPVIATTASTPDSPVYDVDEQLSVHFRPHQVTGVEFLCRSVLGLRHKHGQGCILADEMGLGKTLTSIAAVHTLLKHKHIRNALIVCPVTLIANWKNEFAKWLPPARNPHFGVLCVDQNGLGNGSLKNPAVAFFNDRQFRSHQVLIVGYERVRLLVPQLTTMNKTFDLVICDEGHRLKSAQSRTVEAIESICEDRRILLTGTPVQNDLGEFWALANFVNPGMFGSESQFQRKFAAPLAQSQPLSQDDATIEGLIELCDEVMLRRDANVLEKYINVPKTEYVVFCRPTALQKENYKQLLHGYSEGILNDLGTSIDQSQVLQAISELRKAAAGSSQEIGGKMELLSKLIDVLRQQCPEEKIVIVSGSTRVLDMCQDLCIDKREPWLRLDGSTPQDRRVSSVELFNERPASTVFAFLLSSRSGGMGLNLVGASRLVLLDCDWNPAIDAQVMGRIHRDGQKRACHIYRFLTTGTIDEKMFQRQLVKIGISQHIMRQPELTGVASDFSRENLRDLFTYVEPEKCNTLDIARQTASIKGYVEQTEYDDVFTEVMQTDLVSYVLVKKVNNNQVK